MTQQRCSFCGDFTSGDHSARAFDGGWYHAKCIRPAVDQVSDELQERGLKPGDLVYVVLPSEEPEKVVLYPAELVKFVAKASGWFERWKVHYIDDTSEETYERLAAPPFLINRVSGLQPISALANSGVLYSG